MFIGASYYPEFYSREQWDKDIELMSEIGFNVVRIAEFTWCRMEPREGEYDFTWLEEIIDKFARKAIKTVLCTPTGSPPQWLIKKHPDILPVDNRGIRFNIGGGFGQYCKNHPEYREYTKAIVQHLVNNFKENPNVIMYQIDNEFMGQPCYCDYCRDKYVQWIKKEHKTIEGYNKNLMTIFQGRELGDFDEIVVPKKSRSYINPAYSMDYKKFTSDSYVEYCKIQAGIIRDIDPDVLITSNYTGAFQDFDHFEMAKLFDIAGFDVYPKADDGNMIHASYRLDLTRGLKKQNFWILEQQCSPAAFRENNYAVEPMETRLFTYKSIAHGADGIVYFRWNTPHSGGERFGAGILKHDNNKNRTFNEIKKTCKEINKLSSILDGSKKRDAKAAIVFSNLSIWAVEEDRRISKKVNYRDELLKYYRYFEDNNVDVDFVRPGDDISQYNVILAPLMTVVTKDDAKWLNKYVEEGGTAVFGYMSGIFNEYNQISSNYYQGELRDLLGIRVLEWGVPYENQEYTFSFNNEKYPAEVLNMIVELEGAEKIAEYNCGFYKGTPTITVNQFGRGYAYYVASSSNQNFFNVFIGDVMERHSQIQSMICGKGLDIKERLNGDKRLFFVMNPGSDSIKAELNGVLINALTGEKVKEKLLIEPKDVVLLTYP